MPHPYALHLPFVLLFLAFVACFVAVHVARGRD
jgi:hypothetical protein